MRPVSFDSSAVICFIELQSHGGWPLYLSNDPFRKATRQCSGTKRDGAALALTTQQC